MNKLTKVVLGVSTGLTLSLATSASFAMNPNVEHALIDTCKSTLSNSPMKVRKTIKSHRLDMKTVALKVMCNGQDIIAFAEKHGADKSAEKLQDSIGGVKITDVAKAERINVNFELNTAN